MGAAQWIKLNDRLISLARSSMHSTRTCEADHWNDRVIESYLTLFGSYYHHKTISDLKNIFLNKLKPNYEFYATGKIVKFLMNYSLQN